MFWYLASWNIGSKLVWDKNSTRFKPPIRNGELEICFRVLLVLSFYGLQLVESHDGGSLKRARGENSMGGWGPSISKSTLTTCTETSLKIFCHSKFKVGVWVCPILSYSFYLNFLTVENLQMCFGTCSKSNSNEFLTSFGVSPSIPNQGLLRGEFKNFKANPIV